MGASQVTAISCERVTKTYRHGFLQKKTKPALNDLSFSVNSGEVLGIIGPNGAGKSTIIKSIMGFIKPDQGNITINGIHSSNLESHAHIGYLSETPCLYKTLSLKDHLQFAARLAKLSKKETNKKIEEVIAKVDLPEAAHLPIGRYSKGMTQRAALAYALLLNPQILILDEPMSGLDPLGRSLVVDIIHEYNKRGNTILFCSHILSDVERICTRIGIMHEGRLATITSPTELNNMPELKNDKTTHLETLFLKTVKGTL